MAIFEFKKTLLSFCVSENEKELYREKANKQINE